MPPAGTGNEGRTEPSGARRGRRVHDAATTSGAMGDRRPLEQRGPPTGEVGKVERVPAGLAIRPLDRVLATLHPLPKGRGWLVRQAVVVLDQVDPGEGE